MRPQLRTCVAASAALLLSSAALFAQAPGQAPPSSKAVVLKGKAPVSNEILKVTLPKPKEVQLPNGIHLMVLEDRRAPQVAFTLLIPGAGGYFDAPDAVGLASVTAAVMREGTTSRTSQQISEQLETMAAALNVGTGMASLDATITGSALTEHFEKLLDLTADVLLNPSFPDDELARYKQRTQAQLMQQRANPGFLASELFSRVMYADHPASRISISSDALTKATRPALIQFHKSRYVPDHAAIAIAGDISLAEARRLVEAKLGAWKNTGSMMPTAKDPPPTGPAKVHLVNRPNSVQTNYWVGAPGIERTNPDYDVMQVMNSVIGGGPTGRLFTILREEKGYTYGAYSGVTAGRFKGNWNASTDVRTDVTEPALRDLLAEITRLRDETVSDKELKDKQRSLVAAFALSLESPQQVLGYYTTRWVYHLPENYWDTYPQRVMAVTSAQVQATARKYLAPSRLQIVAVGDGSKVESILRKFGPLDVYDTEGKLAVPKTVP